MAERIEVDQRDARYLSTLEQLLAIQAVAIKPALDEASDLLHATLDAEKIDIFLHDPGLDTLVAYGTSNTPMGHLQHSIGLDRLPVANGGRAVEVFLTGHFYLAGHVEDDEDELPGVRERLGVRSAIAVPVDVEGQRRGVLSAQSAQAERFTEHDLHFLEAVARWIGLLTHRAELVEGLTRAAVEQGQRQAADELITVLAHDLRNHITPLMGRLALIRRRAFRERQASYLQDADEASAELRRLNRMINDLLDVARLDQGLFALRLEPVDIAKLARETAATIQTESAPITVHAPAELVATVDPERLRQALENLLANARLHSPERAIITLDVASDARDDAPWVRIAVTDQGEGIAPEVRDRLFVRFAAGAGSQGLGLGLYLAHQIALAHGGTLTAESRPGKGARFTLTLPADPAPPS